jgi:hypothetical protein
MSRPKLRMVRSLTDASPQPDTMVKERVQACILTKAPGSQGRDSATFATWVTFLDGGSLVEATPLDAATLFGKPEAERGIKSRGRVGDDRVAASTALALGISSAITCPLFPYSAFRSRASAFIRS